VQVRVARELVAHCRELTRQADRLEREIETLVRREAPQLLALPGCGAPTAAKLVGEVAGIERFRTDAQRAMHAGVAPLDVSSGRQQRHRLNRAGNRQLNRALHTIAIVQKRVYAPAKAYIARHQADGKTNKEALRALKRQLARRVFNILHLIAGRTKTPQRIQISAPPLVPRLMDDWSASDRAPAAVSGPALNHPRPMTLALARARPFMDDFHASSDAGVSGRMRVASRRALDAVAKVRGVRRRSSTPSH
jgi:hypothetical protein